MGINKHLKKIMILGSGPIIIGQAAEFDYSGTQACKAIKEEGIETILVNSNPATIMTDTHIADKVYIEPINAKVVEKIIKKEKPDGILAGFGGQTALNVAMELEELEIFKKNNVKLLGINSEAIKKAENREKFKELMLNIKQPIPISTIGTSVEDGIKFVKENSFPVIIRPAYTLGGTGGGIAKNMDELLQICSNGIKISPIGQILLEQSVAGWKELEYEVIRDKKDNCIIVCNMENVDPVGIHTGDSIVVAPSQTLRDKEYHMLRKAAINIIRSLDIKGGCNIQFALNPQSSDYVVIEVNPRVSRSSALASKATGYPIAKIAAKISIGYTLDELKNCVTGNSSACFEPSLDYIVTKIPKWSFDKFSNTERNLGTQMKATGEVMAISRTFESSLMKAITSLEGKFTGLKMYKMEEMSTENILKKIKMQDDQRIFAIAEALRRKITIDEIYNITKIDKWFLNGINNIIKIEKRLSNEKINRELIYNAEAMGFTEKEICEISGIKKNELIKIRNINNIYPVYKMVDTCSGEFETKIPYYYSCYETENENIVTKDKKILIIGSGPIRIGQGIEFDYCCVQGVLAIKEAGYKAIIVNNNPETVSTDFDIADKLYFEPIYIDDIMNIIKEEKPEGVIVQFGGQTSINISEQLNQRKVKILGTSFESIDLAEDRDKFENILKELNIPSPPGRGVTNLKQVYEVVEELGYPVILRPSYVIGGRAMKVVYNKNQLAKYIDELIELSTEHPILIDKYIKGTEIEVDVISDGKDILIPGIMEHIERTGVHSGDSITVYPSITLSKQIINIIKEYTKKIAKKLKIVGLINIQYVFDGKNVYVIEVNPRASRTIPIVSKVTQVPMVKLATDVMLGKKLIDFKYGTGLLKNENLYAVKIPIFSSEKFCNSDIYLGPEMKSTGEVLGIDKELDKAIYKGFISLVKKIPTQGNIYISLRDIDKEEGYHIVKKYYDLGFKIYSSQGTGNFLKKKGVICNIINLNCLIEFIEKGEINIIINTPTQGNNNQSDGFKLRKMSEKFRILIFTCIDTAEVFLKAINIEIKNKEISYKPINEYFFRN